MKDHCTCSLSFSDFMDLGLNISLLGGVLLKTEEFFLRTSFNMSALGAGAMALSLCFQLQICYTMLRPKM